MLTAAGVLPDGPFPQDEKLKDGMVFPAATLIFSSFSFPLVLVTLLFLSGSALLQHLEGVSWVVGHSV